MLLTSKDYMIILVIYMCYEKKECLCVTKANFTSAGRVTLRLHCNCMRFANNIEAYCRQTSVFPPLNDKFKFITIFNSNVFHFQYPSQVSLYVLIHLKH